MRAFACSRMSAAKSGDLGARIGLTRMLQALIRATHGTETPTTSRRSEPQSSYQGLKPPSWPGCIIGERSQPTLPPVFVTALIPIPALPLGGNA
jgi:hypothetical protein